MILLTKKLLKRLPTIQDIEDDPDPMVICKFFFPAFSWTWYVIAYEPQTKICFGFVDGDFPELGDFSLEELTSNRDKLGLPIERDRYFKPCRLSELRRKLGR